MKRVTYLLKDEVSTVRARWVLPESEHPTLEPWMIHSVRTRGWRLEAWEDERESGVQIHGWADWQSVADNLASVLKVLLSDNGFESEEEAEALLEQARGFLDDYEVAQLEVVMAAADAEPQTGDPDQPDDAEA